MDTQPGNLGGQPEQPQRFSAPPPPEVALRTMESDSRSIARGEAVPIPESVLPPEAEKEAVFRPETQMGSDSSIEPEEQPKKKKTLLWVVLAVVIVALGAGGYFAYPLLMGAPQPAPESVTPPSAITPKAAHASYFIAPPEGIAEVRLDSLLIATISNALQNVSASSALPPGSVQEVKIFDDQESQIPFYSFISAFASNPAALDPGKWFEDDFTAFLYYSNDGFWPGYVAKIKTGVNIDELKQAVALMESSDLGKFYIKDPGAFAVFKDGQVNGRAARYASGSIPGVAFSHTLFDGHLLLSTNYEGAQKAAGLLGY